MRFVPSMPDQTSFARSPRRVPCLRMGACALAFAVMTACHDAPTDPLATLVTPETAPALDVEMILPTLPDLAARTGTEAELARPVLDWIRSWNEVDGARTRDRAVAEAAPVLARALGTGGVTHALAPLFQVSRSLAAITAPPPELQRTLDEVGLRTARARTALAQDRPSDAIAEGLTAADRVRSASPEQVARALLARGEQSLADSLETTRSDADRERGRILLQRARQALEAGDYPRAVQRAFYACQLLQPSDSRATPITSRPGPSS